MSFAITIESITVKPLKKATEDVLMVEGLYEGVSVTFPMGISALPSLRIGNEVEINFLPWEVNVSTKEIQNSDLSWVESEVFENEKAESEVSEFEFFEPSGKAIESENLIPETFDEVVPEEKAEVKVESSSVQTIETVDNEKEKEHVDPAQSVEHILDDLREILLKDDTPENDKTLEVEENATYEIENIPQLDEDEINRIVDGWGQEND